MNQVASSTLRFSHTHQVLWCRLWESTIMDIEWPPFGNSWSPKEKGKFHEIHRHINTIAPKEWDWVRNSPSHICHLSADQKWPFDEKEKNWGKMKGMILYFLYSIGWFSWIINSLSFGCYEMMYCNTSLVAPFQINSSSHIAVILDIRTKLTPSQQTHNVVSTLSQRCVWLGPIQCCYNIATTF